MARKIHFIPLLAVVAILFSSCGEDRTDEFMAKTEVDNWIEAQMKEMYLYYQDMPQLEAKEYFKPADAFFSRLLAPQDKYSYVEMETESQVRSSIRDVTYGFDFVLTDDPTGTSRQVARVLQVLPLSPAETAGLHRGDFITQVDGNNVTGKNVSLLESGNGVTLTVATLSVDSESGTPVWSAEPTEIILPASVSMENSPFFATKLIATKDDKRIGYLAYNDFKMGVDINDATYLEQMLQTFRWFKQKKVTDFVLDLRYNQGGQVACAQVLASLLVPVDCMGQEFAHFEFNDKQQDSNYALKFLSEYADYNLNLNRIFIISGLYTASASEMMINCLRPYMTINLLGTKTLGKNVAMSRMESPYGFVLHPVTSIIYNKNGQSDYANGFTPEYIISELNYYPWYELGDPNELLMKNALQWINGDVPGDAENIQAPEAPIEPELSGMPELSIKVRLSKQPISGYSSVLKRKVPSAILPQ